MAKHDARAETLPPPPPPPPPAPDKHLIGLIETSRRAEGAKRA